MSIRRLIFWLSVIALLLWYYWPYLFPKQLDSTDIIVMEKGHTMDATGFVYVGVKNVSKARPNQYKDFLPKVAATIADSADENTYIYFLMYDRYTRDFVGFWAPYQLEEEVPNRLLLMEHWKCGKEPAFVRWYIPALKSLNTEFPDTFPVEDIRVEQVKEN